MLLFQKTWRFLMLKVYSYFFIIFVVVALYALFFIVIKTLNIINTNVILMLLRDFYWVMTPNRI